MSEREHIRQMSPRGRFFMALAFFFFGGFLLAMVFGWIHVDPSRIHAPLWVLGAAAMVFVLGGGMILLAESERYAWLRNLVVWLFVLCLALPFNWIAFGEGERAFSSSSSMMGVGSYGSASETEGRTVFGFFAVLMDLVVVLMPLGALKRRKPD